VDGGWRFLLGHAFEDAQDSRLFQRFYEARRGLTIQPLLQYDRLSGEVIFDPGPVDFEKPYEVTSDALGIAAPGDISVENNPT
jgi:hypothetical protein